MRDEKLPRRKTTFKERTTPCKCCGFPLSQRHHLWEVEYFGENNGFVALCGSCHDLYHVLFKAIVKDNRYKQRLLRVVEGRSGSNDKRLLFLKKMLEKNEREKAAVKQASDLLVRNIEKSVKDRFGEDARHDLLDYNAPKYEPVNSDVAITISVDLKRADGTRAVEEWRLFCHNASVERWELRLE